MHHEVKYVFLLCENDVDGKICNFSQRKHFFLLVALPRGLKTHNIRIKKVAQFNLTTFCMFRFFQNLAGFGRKTPKKSRIPHVFALLSAKGSQDTRSRSTKVRLCSFRYQKTRTNRAQTPVNSPAPTVILLKFPAPSCLQERKS